MKSPSEIPTHLQWRLFAKKLQRDAQNRCRGRYMNPCERSADSYSFDSCPDFSLDRGLRQLIKRLAQKYCRHA